MVVLDIPVFATIRAWGVRKLVRVLRLQETFASLTWGYRTPNVLQLWDCNHAPRDCKRGWHKTTSACLNLNFLSLALYSKLQIDIMLLSWGLFSRAVTEMWHLLQITLDRIRELIREMPDRCKDQSSWKVVIWRGSTNSASFDRQANKNARIKIMS